MLTISVFDSGLVQLHKDFKLGELLDLGLENYPVNIEVIEENAQREGIIFEKLDKRAEPQAHEVQIHINTLKSLIMYAGLDDDSPLKEATISNLLELEKDMAGALGKAKDKNITRLYSSRRDTIEKNLIETLGDVVTSGCDDYLLGFALENNEDVIAAANENNSTIDNLVRKFVGVRELINIKQNLQARWLYTTSVDDICRIKKVMETQKCTHAKAIEHIIGTELSGVKAK